MQKFKELYMQFQNLTAFCRKPPWLTSFGSYWDSHRIWQIEYLVFPHLWVFVVGFFFFPLICLFLIYVTLAEKQFHSSFLI